MLQNRFSTLHIIHYFYHLLVPYTHFPVSTTSTSFVTTLLLLRVWEYWTMIGIKDGVSIFTISSFVVSYALSLDKRRVLSLACSWYTGFHINRAYTSLLVLEMMLTLIPRCDVRTIRLNNVYLYKWMVNFSNYIVYHIFISANNVSLWYI